MRWEGREGRWGELRRDRGVCAGEGGRSDRDRGWVWANPLNGGQPASISVRVAPRPHTSTEGVRLLLAEKPSAVMPVSCSGAAYAGVPCSGGGGGAGEGEVGG